MNDNLQLLVKRAEIEFFPWAIESVTIETDDQLKNANDMLGIGKKIEKALEAQRVADKAPSLAEGKRIDGEYNPIISRVHLGVSRIDQAVLTYHRKKKAEADALLKMQAEEQAAKRKAAEDAMIKQLQENMAKAEECRETGEVFEPEPLPSLPEPEMVITAPVGQTVRGYMSSTTIIEDYEYQIIDEDLVERSLCIPDMKKIKARHKSGVKSIPGVLITMRERTSTRVG